MQPLSDPEVSHQLSYLKHVTGGMYGTARDHYISATVLVLVFGNFDLLHQAVCPGAAVNMLHIHTVSLNEQRSQASGRPDKQASTLSPT